MLALELLLRPDAVERCVVVNSSAGQLSGPFSRMQPRFACALARSLFTSPAERERRLMPLVISQPAVVAAVLPEWQRLAREQPPKGRVIFAQLRAAQRWRLPGEERRRQLGPRILFLNSDGDLLANPECSVRLARAFEGSRLMTHPTAGHDLTTDAGQWVADSVRDWMQDAERPADLPVIGPAD